MSHKHLSDELQKDLEKAGEKQERALEALERLEAADKKFRACVRSMSMGADDLTSEEIDEQFVDALEDLRHVVQTVELDFSAITAHYKAMWAKYRFRGRPSDEAEEVSVSNQDPPNDPDDCYYSID